MRFNIKCDGKTVQQHIISTITTHSTPMATRLCRADMVSLSHTHRFWRKSMLPSRSEIFRFNWHKLQSGCRFRLSFSFFSPALLLLALWQRRSYRLDNNVRSNVDGCEKETSQGKSTFHGPWIGVQNRNSSPGGMRMCANGVSTTIVRVSRANRKSF